MGALSRDVSDAFNFSSLLVLVCVILLKLTFTEHLGQTLTIWLASIFGR